MKEDDWKWYGVIEILHNLDDAEDRLWLADKIVESFKRRDLYKLYLKTKHWKDMTAEKRLAEDWKCNECGSKGWISHHVNYDSLQHEKMCDLKLLCDKCHKKVHGK